MKRRIIKVFSSSRFEKELNRLPRVIQELARRKDKQFREDAFTSSLETHKLGGKFEGDWAYSVNRSYRVHFRFFDDHTVAYINIGTHEIYR